MRPLARLLWQNSVHLCDRSLVRHGAALSSSPYIIDASHLRRCVSLAREAGRAGEVPVGAVIVGPCGESLAEAANSSVLAQNAASHAEMVSLAAACRAAGSSRLDGCTLYVSLEPCVMCYGALLLYRVRRIVYCTPSPKFGAVSLGVASVLRGRFNHEAVAEEAVGPLGLESAGLLREFFRSRRQPSGLETGRTCSTDRAPQSADGIVLN